MFPKKDNFWEKVQEWKKKKWEISMHGFSHIYENNTKKKDYFGHGGNSEFYGHPYEVQSLKIKKGLKIFTEKNIKIKSFFAPNHTYDLNTFRARDPVILALCSQQNFEKALEKAKRRVEREKKAKIREEKKAQAASV